MTGLYVGGKDGRRAQARTELPVVDGSNNEVNDVTAAELAALSGLLASATELNALDFDDIEAITATSDGLTTGIIPDGKLLIICAVTSASANNIVTLPSPTPGTIVVLMVGTNGCELRSDTPASVAISGGSGASAESALPADTLAVAVCISATAWLGFDITGTTLAAIEAAA